MKLFKLYRYNFLLLTITLLSIVVLFIYKGYRDGFSGNDWMPVDKTLIGLSVLGILLSIIGIGQAIYKCVRKQIFKGVVILITSGLAGCFILFILFVYVFVRAGGPPVDDYDRWKPEKDSEVKKQVYPML